jgi:hypothetical protein
MMIRNMILIGVIMAMLFAANPTQAAICEIINGSFEDDGRINDITSQDPNGWAASVPTGKFTAKTDNSWKTDGIYSLNISSQWFTAFAAGDMATVSQQVYLTDVSEIKFDLKMDTYTGLAWDSTYATAVVMIDDEVVWEPNNAEPDLGVEYIDQSFPIESKYKDDNLHTLSLGLKINVDTENGFFEFYRTWWDSIECTNIICGGDGLLDGDFNQDCYVDIYDLQLAADVWLAEVPASDIYNLYKGDDIDTNGIVNFLDFSILAGNWLLSSYQE